MVKTLRITGILAAVLGFGFLVFAAVYGVEPDPQVEKFLASESVVEQFKKQSKTRQNEGLSVQESPLVQQAIDFSRYLNPPVSAPPPQPTNRTSARTARPTPPRPTTVSVKFDLVGTSVHPKDPSKSLALINQPGSGYRWVREQDQISHLVIEQIKDGVVVVRDGQNTSEVTPNRPREKNFVVREYRGDQVIELGAYDDSDSPSSSSQPAEMMSTPTAGASPRPRPRAGLRPTAQQTQPQPKPRIEDDPEALNELIQGLQSMQQDVANEEGDSENLAMMNEILTDLKEMQVSEDEANELGELGEMLEELADDNELPQNPNDLGEE